MTPQDIALLDKARDEFLKMQRECAWCGFNATTRDELIDHIIANHQPEK